MGLQVLYVLTHDSIGLGEDGPTHQPIEHLLSLRAIPNLNVFRPCDLEETIDCYEKLLEFDDNKAPIYYELGHLYLSKDDKINSISAFKLATEFKFSFGTVNVLEPEQTEYCTVIDALKSRMFIVSFHFE